MHIKEKVKKILFTHINSINKQHIQYARPYFLVINANKTTAKAFNERQEFSATDLLTTTGTIQFCDENEDFGTKLNGTMSCVVNTSE